MTTDGLPPPPDYDSPTALKAFLEREGLAMSKRFGQNFLISRGARRRVLAELGLGDRASGEPEAAGASVFRDEGGAAAEASAHGAGRGAPAPAVWEIGPGLGAMTALALESGLAVTAFEIDHGFARVLRRTFGASPSFRLVEGDFLDTWKAELAAGGAPPERIFGNLPYSAANAIVAAILEGLPKPPPMVFTVQKEAALRMAAKPGSKDYSAFSVLCSSVCKVRLAFDLGSSSFWPAPNVTSTVVTLAPRREPVAAGDRLGFSAFVRSAFSSRRKTLKNNLRAAGRTEGAVAEALDSLGIRADVRAEALAPEELAAVYAALKP